MSPDTMLTLVPMSAPRSRAVILRPPRLEPTLVTNAVDTSAAEDTISWRSACVEIVEGAVALDGGMARPAGSSSTAQHHQHRAAPRTADRTTPF